MESNISSKSSCLGSRYTVDPDQVDYLTFLYNINITTVFLRFTVSGQGGWDHRTDSSNLLVHTYYEFAADPSLCAKIRSRDTACKYFTWMPYCTSSKRVIVNPGSLHVDLLHPQGYLFSAYGFTSLPNKPPEYITYLSLIPNAYIGENGTVVYKRFTIYAQSVPQIDKQFLTVTDVQHYLFYDEVLSIAQMYQKNVFHIVIDSVQRIIPYLTYLQINQDVKVHVGCEINTLFTEMLAILGIPKHRLVSGIIKANVVYFPQGSDRGFVHVQNVQLLSTKFLQYIKNRTKYHERRSVILIRRTVKRYMLNELEFEQMVEKIAYKHGLKIEIYGDDPPPSLEITMRLFNRAVLVVAPHGAGLYNMIYCEPGTYIIEVFCPWMIILASMRLAHVLGHRYYACAGLRGCKAGTEIDLTHVEGVLQYYMPHAAQLSQ